MKKKRILILGGSPFQIPVIRYARSAGYHTITCDYRPENPGHALADEYHNVSTTDLEGVLSLARRRRPDGILAYASDPAAPTAAYVGNQLGLPSNPYEAVRILANKDLYRETLRRQGFPAPRAWTVAQGANHREALDEVPLPVMVKPVDSSGSKGVSKVETRAGIDGAIEHAMQFSRVKRVILEEYIVQQGPQIGGEAFVRDGRLVFLCLGDQQRDPQCNPYVPTGMLFPSRISADVIARVASDLQRLIEQVGFSFGGLNLEIMRAQDGRLYLMEVGPRTGGNFLPELMRYCMHANLARYSVESALGQEVTELPARLPDSRCDGFFAYYAIHSRTEGIFRSLRLDAGLQPHVLEAHPFKQPGDRVEVYQGSNCTVGILLLGFDTRQQMEDLFSRMADQVVIETASNGETSRR